jgi:hypothetical protein
MTRFFIAGIAALLLATGAAHADAVYDDDWDWSGCKEDDPAPYDEQYYSCENGRDFEFFKHGNKRGYKRGGRICNQHIQRATRPRQSASCVGELQRSGHPAT